MSEWVDIRLADIAKPGRENFVDGDWIEAPYIADEGVRLIQTGNIGVGKFIDKNKKYISEESFKELRCKAVNEGDVLICRLAEPAGRSCIAPKTDAEKNITSVDVTIFRVDEERFSKPFVVHSINTQEFLDRCQEVAGGTTRTRISRSNLGNLILKCPPLEQQQKIAHILTTVDNLIEKTQALIDTYTAVKQGMMHDLFTRGIDLATGQLRPSYEQAPELYKETELGWVPREWNCCSLGSCAEKITSGSRDWANYYSDEGDLFVRIGNLTREHINFRWDSIQRVSLGKGSEGQRTKLEEGDILISITADLGIVAVVPPDFENAYINQHVALVRIKSEEVNTRYVGHYLSSFFGFSQFDRLNDSGAKAGLNLPTVSLLLFAKPAENEQEFITSSIDSIDKTVRDYKRENEYFMSIKKGLMQDLFTGRVRVA